jgi:hypothetical protein
MPSLRIWRDALAFHLDFVRHLTGWAPLLWVPILSDVLQSFVMRATDAGEPLDIRRILAQSRHALLPTLGLKIGSELRSIAWNLIPVIFIVRVIEHRLCWGLASSVVAFEDLRGDAADARCRQLARDGYTLGLRALVGWPTVWLTLSLVAANFAADWTRSRAVFWLLVAAWWWIFIPGAGAANTLCYLQLRDAEQSAEPAA